MSLRFRFSVVAVLVLVVGGCLYAVHAARLKARATAPLIGMVRRTEIRIAPELSGRLGAVSVKPGAHVSAGEEVARLEALELTANLVQAQASAASTAADRANLYAGVRAEEQQIARDQIKVAAANLDYDKQELDRTNALAAKGFASHERLDQATANYVSDSAALALRKATFAAAAVGPTVEQAVAATIAEHLAKTRIDAPVSGVIGTLVGEPGEIVRTGETILTIVPDKRPWFTFTAREDRLNGVAIGAKLRVLRDDGKITLARVAEFRPLGDFATWEAARAVGDHDLNSFFLRLEPVSDADDDLAPGMSVWLLEPG